MTDLTVEDYTEKSIVVRGNTQEYKTQLASLGGKWNANLRGGGGWIFSKKSEDKVLEFISAGDVQKTDNELLTLVEKAFKTMLAEEKLEFVSQVAKLAVSKTQPKNTVTKPRDILKPNISQNLVGPVHEIVFETDSDSDDEDDVGNKRPTLRLL
jgi:hypothetical protein